MNLVIDIGNTRTKIALFDQNNPVTNYSFTDFKEEQLKKILDDYPGTDKAILSSVAVDSSGIFRMVKNFIPYTLYLDENTPLPINNKYESKETLGKDRLAAVVGANFIFPQDNVLVIDAGTAITFEIIDNKGNYLGGNISPGLTIRYKALHTFTGRLPLLTINEKFPQLGTDTNSAIISGIQKGMIYEINGYIDQFSELFPPLKIILTGGDANFFDKKLKNTIFVNLNLVITGLNRILEYNAAIL